MKYDTKTTDSDGLCPFTLQKLLDKKRFWVEKDQAGNVHHRGKDLKKRERRTYATLENETVELHYCPYEGCNRKYVGSYGPHNLFVHLKNKHPEYLKAEGLTYAKIKQGNKQTAGSETQAPRSRRTKRPRSRPSAALPADIAPALRTSLELSSLPPSVLSSLPVGRIVTIQSQPLQPQPLQPAEPCLQHSKPVVVVSQPAPAATPPAAAGPLVPLCTHIPAHHESLPSSFHSRPERQACKEAHAPSQEQAAGASSTTTSTTSTSSRSSSGSSKAPSLELDAQDLCDLLYFARAGSRTPPAVAAARKTMKPEGEATAEEAYRCRGGEGEAERQRQGLAGPLSGGILAGPSFGCSKLEQLLEVLVKQPATPINSSCSEGESEAEGGHEEPAQKRCRLAPPISTGTSHLAASIGMPTSLATSAFTPVMRRPLRQVRP